MVNKIVSVCDQCGKEEDTNDKWNTPDNWFDIKIEQMGKNVESWLGIYCSKKCIIERINNHSP